AILLAPTGAALPRRLAQAAVAIAVAGAFGKVYFVGWYPRLGEPPPVFAWAKVPQYTTFVLAYLGCAIGVRDVAVAARWGRGRRRSHADRGARARGTGSLPRVTRWRVGDAQSRPNATRRRQLPPELRHGDAAVSAPHVLGRRRRTPHVSPDGAVPLRTVRPAP